MVDRTADIMRKSESSSRQTRVVIQEWRGPLGSCDELVTISVLPNCTHQLLKWLIKGHCGEEEGLWGLLVR